ncbi:MAG: transaldolase [Chloroflexi bacterium]|mgnify:CR=1 FL=1|nr:transaldolase [Chloroflexota bacterium]
MKFFLDSAQADEIRHALEMWDIDGVTTNPRHVQVSGKPFVAVVREIGTLFAGTDKTVSVEVNPHHTRVQDMVEEGTRLAALCDNFVIKLPATEAGFAAIPVLAERGVRVNLTLVFSTVQALQAMRMGATYVSPFIGWKESNAEETRTMIEEIVAVRDNYGFGTEVLVAAVRNGRQIADAAVARADIVTAGFAVYQEAFAHPYTDVGLARFQGFWDQTQYE